mgnify:CR=1 FL=1
MIITDLTQDDTHFDSFLKLVKEAYTTNFTLSNNYKNILDTYNNYKAFILLLDDNEPVAFCGLQHFDTNSIRTYSRYYLSRKYRFYNNTFLHTSKYIMPWSIQYAEDNNYSYLFTSFQSNLKRKRIANVLCDHANKYTSKDWVVLDNLHNTCKNNIDKPQCWQYIIRCTLKGDGEWNLIYQQH